VSASDDFWDRRHYRAVKREAVIRMKMVASPFETRSEKGLVT